MDWCLKPKSEIPAELKTLKLNPITLQLLIGRGFFSKRQVESFLKTSYDGLHSADGLRGVADAVERIAKARERKEKVTIFGDYDADGITSTALLKEALEEIGLEPTTYIPDRNKEGYGLNKEALDYIKKTYGSTLLITVDCGISNVQEIAAAKKSGLDVIVVDHHSVPKALPQGCIIINPKLEGQKYPFRELAGVGVVFKLVQALWQKFLPKKKEQLKWFLDIVAIGTIADCVPLVDENRIFAKFGLIVLQKTRRAGITELIKTARLNISETNPPDAQHVAFQIGPRFNAAGRVDHADLALALLLEKNPVQARLWALELESKNTERQKITQAVYQEVKKTLSDEKEYRLIIRSGEHWPLGIVGVVAGKIAEEFNCPVFLLRDGGAILEGSGRSQEHFDLFAASAELDDLLEKYGGHAQAMGIKIKPKNLKKFEDGLLKTINRQYDKETWGKKIFIDARIEPRQLDWDLLNEIQAFEPFGEGNREAVFLTSGLRVKELRVVGNGQKHLKLLLESKDKPAKNFEGIFFRGAEKMNGLKIGDEVEVIHNLRSNTWNGSQKIELHIMDIKLQKEL